jgi:hypothetical protein
MLVSPLAVILWNCYSRGEDLVTPKNLFLVGCANFMGVAGLSCGVAGLYYGEHPLSDGLWFITGVILFFIGFVWSYRRWRLPQRISQRVFAKSPPVNLFTLNIAGAALLMTGVVSAVLPVDIPIIGQILDMLGKQLPAGAVALFLVAWLRSPINVIYLFGAGASMAMALFIAFFGAGRHPLFSAMIAVLIAWYWSRWRYQRQSLTIAKLTGLGIGAFLVILVYSSFRHDFMGEADSAIAIDRFKQLMRFELNMGGAAEDYLREDAVAVGLLCVEKFHRTGDPEYFHTVKFVLANPIPRDWWPNKPQALGESLPESLGKFSTGYVNWGPSIIGNAFHDGGILMTAVFGVIVGGFLRIFDDVIRRQPGNPWPIALLAAMSPKIVGYSRGDISIYTVEIIGLSVIMFGLMYVLRAFFGTQPDDTWNEDDDPDEDHAYEWPEDPDTARE